VTPVDKALPQSENTLGLGLIGLTLLPILDESPYK
jgi:hypothetical protein